jgi:XTP/dITP diphosphohydrolase
MPPSLETMTQPFNPERTLVIASGNAGKVREFGALLADLDLDTCAQPEGLEVEETGTTFKENARLKAMAVARATGCWALADDSGLSVAALGGAPGVHSARYAASDATRITRLLEELAAAGAIDAQARNASFTAALALAEPSGTVVLEVEGVCPGTILEAPRGDGGFGYDPLFIPNGESATFAELPGEVKNRLSHRARAFAAFREWLSAARGM